MKKQTVSSLEKKLSDVNLTGVDLSLRDVIECIADGFRIESMRFITPDPKYELDGLYCNDYGKKEILINSETNLDTKRVSAIHELYHYVFDKMGLEQNEIAVEYLAQKKFIELYKHTPDE